MTKISIVTPSFKQAGFLRLCAKSVADQSGRFTHEHLIQDGGDGDEFAQWRSEQSFADVVSEPDSGMYDAINKGFARSSGEILAWLNCDEQYLPGTLERVSEWFESNPDKDILFGAIVLMDLQGYPLAYRKPVLPIRGHVRSCFLPTFSAATFVRRKIIDDGHFLETRFRAISDMVWIDRLMTEGYRMGLTDEILATFTQTGENLGQTPMADEEGDLWRDECHAGGRAKRLFWSSVHRFRKAAAGCYRSRNVRLAVYLPGDENRVIRQGVVHGMWRTLAHTARLGPNGK